MFYGLIKDQALVDSVFFREEIAVKKLAEVERETHPN